MKTADDQAAAAEVADGKFSAPQVSSDSPRDRRCECPSTSDDSFRFPSDTNPPIRQGNPHYGYRMQLYCRTGFHLAIHADGKVDGVDEDMNPHAIMEFSSADVGEVRIRGVEADLYLAMNKKGRLYGEPNPTEEGTVFVESVLGQYNTYLSRKYAHKGWYVGIKKNGKHKLGHRTKWGQKAIQFLPRRVHNT